MATITKTYTENSGQYRATWTVNYTCADVTASASTFSFSPTITAKFTYSGGLQKTHSMVDITIKNSTESGTFHFRRPTSGNTATTEGTTYTITRQTTHTSNTSAFFSSSNPTTKPVTLTWTATALDMASFMPSGIGKTFGEYTGTNQSIGSLCKVTLNAPPTATVTGALTGQPYADACTYTATISSLSAKYGGTISSVKLTIGSQTATRTTNGTLVINPNTAGTFTPTVTITDSRGQKTTKTLSAITIQSNTVAISSLSAGRTDANGIADDENVYARLTLKTTYTPFTGNYLQEPSVTIGGNYESVTWYHNWSSSTGFSNPVDWTNYAPASPVTIYGQVAGTYADTQSYPVSVTVSTTYKSATKSITLAQSFYLLSGRPGGKGLGIGMKPTGDNLYVGMSEYSIVPVGGARSIAIKRSDNTQDIRLHLAASGNRGLYDNVTQNYLIYQDASDVLRMPIAPTMLGHSSAIGTVITDSQTNVSIATGGSLKGTGCSVTLPQGTWIIQYYVGWQNTNGGTYKGIGLRYRAVGTTSWTAMTRSNINVQPIQSDTAVHDTLAGCVVVAPASTGAEYEINVRNSVAGTVNCDLRAVRLL